MANIQPCSLKTNRSPRRDDSSACMWLIKGSRQVDEVMLSVHISSGRIDCRRMYMVDENTMFVHTIGKCTDVLLADE